MEDLKEMFEFLNTYNLSNLSQEYINKKIHKKQAMKRGHEIGRRMWLGRHLGGAGMWNEGLMCSKHIANTCEILRGGIFLNIPLEKKCLDGCTV